MAARKKSSSKKVPVSKQDVVTPQPLMETLREEHRHIASVLVLFEQQLRDIEKGEPVDAHVVYEIMEYMVTWPDRYHHPREDLVYGRVAQLNEAAAEEVYQLQGDHEGSASRGLELLQLIERWSDDADQSKQVVQDGLEYIAHSYQHMNVEEQEVFPRIESVLTAQDWRELAEDPRFKAIADPVFGPTVQRQFRNMARKLRSGVRQSVERGAVAEWVGVEALLESMDVLSIALESARSSAGEHVLAAVDESKAIFKTAPLAAPMRCAVNNTKLTFKLLEDVASISRDAVSDLSRVNQARRKRVELLSR